MNNSRKRDCQRAQKFQVGSEVCSYPWSPTDSGWQCRVYGIIVEILDEPNVKMQYPGLFRVEWKGHCGGKMQKIELARVPNPIPGDWLRFDV